jgi:hypothetical protein
VVPTNVASSTFFSSDVIPAPAFRAATGVDVIVMANPPWRIVVLYA